MKPTLARAISCIQFLQEKLLLYDSETGTQEQKPKVSHTNTLLIQTRHQSWYSNMRLSCKIPTTHQNSNLT